MGDDEGLPRPEDSLTWALQALYAARAAVEVGATASSSRVCAAGGPSAKPSH